MTAKTPSTPRKIAKRELFEFFLGVFLGVLGVLAVNLFFDCELLSFWSAPA
jgi:hypothetical protein